MDRGGASTKGNWNSTVDVLAVSMMYQRVAIILLG